jgi:cysteine synthase A
MSHRLIQEEGLFAGTSGGANVFVAINLAKELGKGCNIATVLPDRGDRYITSEHYVT